MALRGIFVCLVFTSTCKWISSDSSCAQDKDGTHCNENSRTETNKYSEDKQWSHYLNKIQAALDSYTECEQNDCSCHSSVIDEDLAVWEKKGSIPEAEFLKEKKRGIHYQIINHKLYREQQCMFEARCSGVEHFILEIIDRLPNMEFLLNVHDYPQSMKPAPPLPIFSFSKVANEHWDIMYPAWTFWEGGPAVWPIYPTGLGRWDEQREIIPNG